MATSDCSQNLVLETAMKRLIICTAVLGLAFSSAAQAKGCIKGAIVGGVAGSVAGHGKVGAVLPLDGGDAETVIAGFRKLGIDDDALALRLQQEGADSFQKSWDSLLAGIKGKSVQLAGADAR